MLSSAYSGTHWVRGGVNPSDQDFEFLLTECQDFTDIAYRLIDQPTKFLLSRLDQSQVLFLSFIWRLLLIQSSPRTETVGVNFITVCFEVLFYMDIRQRNMSEASNAHFLVAVVSQNTCCIFGEVHNLSGRLDEIWQGNHSVILRSATGVILS